MPCRYDNCGEVNLNSYGKFQAMRDALNATGRQIVFSTEPHVAVPIPWLGEIGNAWRTGGDIGASYSRMMGEVGSTQKSGMILGILVFR